MNKLALLFLLFVPVFVASQDLPSNEKGELVYSEVVKVENATKDELYNRAKLWFATTYNSSNDVLQVKNKENGQLVGNAIFEYNSNIFVGHEKTDGIIKYTIKVFVKEGRYKYIIGPFYHKPDGNNYGGFPCGKITTAPEHPDPKTLAKNWSDKVWNDIQTQIDNNSTALINELKTKMKQPLETSEDNW